MNLSYTDNMGDTVTIITKILINTKENGSRLATYIRVRFPNARAAVTTYEHHRN
jgi:hypothetical protein